MSRRIAAKSPGGPIAPGGWKTDLSTTGGFLNFGTLGISGFLLLEPDHISDIGIIFGTEYFRELDDDCARALPENTLENLAIIELHKDV